MEPIVSVEYVKKSIAQGRSKEDIYIELLNKGHKVASIEGLFKAIQSEGNKTETSKKTISLIVTIGIVLISAGVFSFIAANWSLLPKLVKLGIILSAMVGSYVVGWFLKEKSQHQKTGEACIILGSIFYGAGIFLVAQMFNIRAHWPDGFILWMIGTIIMAFAIELYSLFYIAIPLGSIALIGYMSGALLSFGLSTLFLTSSALLIVATITTFFTAWVFRIKSFAVYKEFY